MKTKKIGLLLVILSIFLSGGIFAMTEEASAYRCEHGDSCKKNGVWSCVYVNAGGSTCSWYTHACSAQRSVSNLAVCLINNLPGEDCHSSAGYTDCSPLSYDTYGHCSEKKCEPINCDGGCSNDESISFNTRDASNKGVKCWVSEVTQGTAGGPAALNVGGNAHFVEGVWDYQGGVNNKGQCVKCGANNKESKIYGDSSANSISFSGNAGNDKFEYACGADSTCDEKSQGNVCTGGHCDLNGICCLSPKIVNAVTGACENAAPTCTENACNLSNQTICKSNVWVTGASYCSGCVHCGDGVKNCSETCDTNGNKGCGDGEICNSCNSCDSAAGNCETDVLQNVGTHNPCGANETCITNYFNQIATPEKFSMGFLDSSGNNYVTSYNYGEKITAYGGVSTATKCPNCKAIICLYKPNGNIQGSGVSLSTGDSKSKVKNSPTSGEWIYVLQYKDDGSSPSCPAGPNCNGTECCLTKVTVGACNDNCDGNEGCQSGIPAGMQQYTGTNKTCCSGTCCETAAAGCVPTEAAESICDDGIDNDCDGFFDCNDLTCVGTPACAAGPGACASSPGCLAVAPVTASSYSISADTCPAGQTCYQCNAGLSWNGADDCIVPAPAKLCGPGTGMFCNVVGWDTIPEIAEGMLNYLLGLVGSIALLFLIIAGVMYMTAGGSEEKITTAKKILTGAIIGLGIVLLAYSLLAEINDILGVI